jgi:hypothetical protein
MAASRFALSASETYLQPSPPADVRELRFFFSWCFLEFIRFEGYYFHLKLGFIKTAKNPSLTAGDLSIRDGINAN